MTPDPRAMSAAEARAIIQRLGWTQKMTAYRLGVSQRGLRRYLAPGGMLPPGKAELLRLIEQKEAPS